MEFMKMMERMNEDAFMKVVEMMYEMLNEKIDLMDEWMMEGWR